MRLRSRLELWCSWLSRLPHTQKALGSNPSNSTIFLLMNFNLFQFLLDIISYNSQQCVNNQKLRFINQKKHIKSAKCKIIAKVLLKKFLFDYNYKYELRDSVSQT
jgi:hypothetical protein